MGSGVVTYYVHDVFGNLATEYNPPVAAACATCYVSWDHLGSTRMVTNENGTIVARHDCLPYGVEIPRSGVWSVTDGLSPKFTGQNYDGETLLAFYEARHLASGLGRFMSVDPGNAGADLGNPQSWNMYSYVGGNPMVYVDPDGLDPCQPFDESGYCGESGAGVWNDDWFPWPIWGGGGEGSGSNAPNPSIMTPVPGTPSGPGSGGINSLQPSNFPNLPSLTKQQIAQLAELLRRLLRKPWVLSWIYPVGPVPGVFGIGPAGSFAWNPETHNFCAGIGAGGSVGRNVSLGPLTHGWTPEGKRASPQEMDGILGGWSISGGLNAPGPGGGPGPGIQVTTNGSGTAVGPTVGAPGASISATTAACGKLW